MRNLLLSCIVIFLGLSFGACADGGPPPEKNVIVEALAAPGAMVLDVRSAGEYAGGHADGAVHVPVKEISERISAIQPNKDQQLIVYCAKGVRAARAKEVLTSLGYTKILNAKTPEAVSKAMGKDLVK